MKSRLYRRVRFYLIIVALSALTGYAGSNELTKHNNDTSQTIYTVVPNDTLWAIAKLYKPSEMDIRDMVADIRKLNQIDSNIIPGQSIVIPVQKSSIQELSK